MLTAITVSLANFSNRENAGLIVEFSAPEYLLNQPILFPFRWGWGGYEIRGAASSHSASVGGVQLRYVGTGAVHARRVTVTFNRAARTAVLSAGTWAGLGFAVGMRLFPQGTANNDRVTKPITTLVGATATFDPPTEGTVAGFSTTGMNPFDEVAVVCDIVEFKPFITLRSAWGAFVHDLKIWNATAYPGGVGLCSHGLWIGMESDVSGWESSSAVRLERVDVSGAHNMTGCSALLIGRPASNPVVGQQCDNIEVVNCYISSTPILTNQPISVSGDTISTLATPGGASAPHTIEDHQPVVIEFTTGGVIAEGLECKVYYARDVNQGAGTLKVSAAPGGAAITATTGGGTTMTVRAAKKADAVYQADGNNTKGIRFFQSKFNGCWSAYRCPAGFENLIFDTCSFDSTDSWAIESYSDVLIKGAICERICKFVKAHFGKVNADACAINAISLDDGWDGISAESTRFVQSSYHDARTNLNITAINTGTDTITATCSAGYPPVNGRRVIFSGNQGPAGLPDSLSIHSEVAENDFYLRDVAHVSGADYTFKLALTVGGAAINLTSNGALGTGGVLNCASELVIQAISFNNTSTVHVDQSYLAHSAALRIGAGNTATGSLVTQPALSVYQPVTPRITGSKNKGGPPGWSRYIPDISNDTLERQVTITYQAYMMQRMPNVDGEQIFEANFDRWNKEAFSPDMFIMFPQRVQVLDLWAEVIPDRNSVTGFAGTGITAMTCSVGVYTGGVSDGTALAAFDMMAYAAKTITASAWSGGVATYVAATHKMSPGDIVTVAGVTPSGYNITGRLLTTTATWTRATTTATVTSIAHGFTTGQVLSVLDSSSLAAIVLGDKTITVTGVDTFTFTCLNAGAVNGMLAMFGVDMFKLAVEVDPGGVGTVFGTVTVNANSRRRGMEPQTRGVTLQTLPWRPTDLVTPANHWTTPANALTVSVVRTGGSLAALTSGRLRIGIRLGRFYR